MNIALASNVAASNALTIDRSIYQLRPEQRQIFFHLHIDAAETFPSILEDDLINMGFKTDHFKGAPDGSGTIVPAAHYTKLYGRGQIDILRGEVKLARNFLNSYVVPSYTEAEIISSEWRGDNFFKNPTGKVRPIPFRLQKKKLSGDKNDCFKKAELHIEMKDSSNPGLLRELQSAGFMPILWNDEFIFTAQGDDAIIQELEKIALQYISEEGGAKELHSVVEIIASDGYSYHGGASYRTQPAIVTDLVINNKC